ncbi:1782_t:CDS:1, partial [Ambispora gerdemannii]
RLEKTIQTLIAEQREARREKDQTKEEMKCLYCGKKGHLIRECRTRLFDQRRERTTNQNNRFNSYSTPRNNQQPFVLYRDPRLPIRQDRRDNRNNQTFRNTLINQTYRPTERRNYNQNNQQNYNQRPSTPRNVQRTYLNIESEQEELTTEESEEESNESDDSS